MPGEERAHAPENSSFSTPQDLVPSRRQEAPGAAGEEELGFGMCSGAEDGRSRSHLFVIQVYACCLLEGGEETHGLLVGWAALLWMIQRPRGSCQTLLMNALAASFIDNKS